MRIARVPLLTTAPTLTPIQHVVPLLHQLQARCLIHLFVCTLVQYVLVHGLLRFTSVESSALGNTTD